MKNLIRTNDPFGLITPFFDEFFSSESNSQYNQVMRTDIEEHEDHYEFSIEVPDIKKENIRLSLDEGYLTIEAHQEKEDKEKKHGKYIRQERYYGSYKRSFYVGEDIKEEDIKAKLEGGVLRLLIEKPKPVEKPVNYISIE